MLYSPLLVIVVLVFFNVSYFSTYLFALLFITSEYENKSSSTNWNEKEASRSSVFLLFDSSWTQILSAYEDNNYYNGYDVSTERVILVQKKK